MNKTGQMIEFEEETGEYAIVTVKVGFAELQFPSEVYVEWLEAELLKASVKASAYDRLMSMNSISENDIQIVLDGNAWCAYRLPFRNLQEDDAGFGTTPQIALTALLESELPDGWEDR